MVETGTLAELRHLTRTEVSFEVPEGAVLPAFPDAHDLVVTQGRARFTVDSDALAAVLPELDRFGAPGLRVEPPSLEELFLRHYGGDGAGHPDSSGR